MKDIENYKLPHVQDALQRLERALVCLESAAGKPRAKPEPAGETVALAKKFDQLSRAHGALKETTGRVARGLDGAISRLSALIPD
ncbi:MAG: hypothetical protein EXQ84_01805 [Rhodospirillaceae bacterium]|nr:hypothetical protein [Rhodospirillaceae bacterium]